LREIKVEIATRDIKLSFDLFETREIKQGMERQIALNLIMRSEGGMFAAAEGSPEIIYLAFEIGKDVAIGVLAAWLYDKLKGRAEKLRIEGIDVQIDEGEIKRVLIERIEKGES